LKTIEPARRAELIRDGTFLAGAGLVLIGLWCIWPPLAFVAAGAALALAAVRSHKP
jgi:hypothetical protein